MVKYLLYGLVAVAAAAVVVLFRTPLKWGLKLLINTALGLVLLFFFNLAGRYIGVTLGINMINGLIVGILGPAGLLALLLVRWLTI